MKNELLLIQRQQQRANQRAASAMAQLLVAIKRWERN